MCDKEIFHLTHVEIDYAKDIARKYWSKYGEGKLHYADLFRIAVLELSAATKLFDSTNQVSYQTFAYPRVRHALTEYVMTKLDCAFEDLKASGVVVSTAKGCLNATIL